jgi:alpha-amylase/alpha-mannosidase (GH57 family)
VADLAFLWHMHQPDYRHPETGHFTLPWALLHALKDYPDMASHLERHPAIRCTVNFVPVLLAQIEDYCDQLATRQWRDPLLRILAWPNPDHLAQADRNWLLDMAFRCHAPTMLEPFAPYRRLRDLLAFVRSQDADGLAYLSGQYYADLATWYVLAWSGESLRRGPGPIAALMAKGGNFELADREALVSEIGTVLNGLIPRYRALADRGQIELSCTPAHHPLAPLLLDFGVAREAHARLPATRGTGLRWRPLSGRGPFAACPAQPPTTLRPDTQGPVAGRRRPVDGLSAPDRRRRIQLDGKQPGRTRHSAGPGADTGVPWQAPEDIPGDLTLFFRNEHLSDLIGFEYARWHGRDAAAHFMSEVATLHERDPEGLIPVFLDGENAWEYYPYNGWYFFNDLYESLARNPAIRTLTLSEATEGHRHRRQRLPRLVAGSWVYGTLSTWIGNPDKNHAWELLCEVKQCADRVLENAGGGRGPTPADRCPAGRMRKLGLVLVAGRLQRLRIRKRLRPAVSRQHPCPLPAPRASRPQQP